ncbi:two-component system CitB family sensor kinase [Streptomyces sp. CG 926]|uniref:sensor histidine kinase n=1 Tax=Streptomyces sp. CG 926 TaxID=1882405 RepID=UPI000D6B0470|nr:sensor histidine kinase [Streptomyces sp. CG 926]PWK75173.1 two-component system CitB family sensor kinase [Streptomyces sp. CG 926]
MRFPLLSARRLGLPRRAVSQILLTQLAIAAGVAVLATGLFLAPLGAQLDDQAMRRALAIAQSAAADPALAAGVLSSGPSADSPVQSSAERIRRATGAEYVVVLDLDGIRRSHPSAERIGLPVSTDPSDALAGREVMEIDEGTLGRSARGKVPLLAADGEIVGAVSVGIAYDSVRDRLLGAIPGLLAYAGGALAAGALAAYLLSRRIQRQTRDLAFSDIAGLLAEREAMLHSIREGVIALAPDGRVRLVNDEAARLLGLAPDAADDCAGRPLEDLLGAGRTADVLSGRVTGRDLLTVQGPRVLVANRMPTEDGGAVATLRDRTELEHLGRELDSTRGLIDALRAQDHEHANRLHTLLGLLELGLHEEAVEFVTEVAGVHRTTAEQVTEKVHDPLLAALLVGKATVAAERGVPLRLAGTSLLPDRLVDPGGLVTILGNLVDNALDAAAGSATPLVEVELRAEGRTAVLRVRDSGPGVPAARREEIFTEGWSTKQPKAHRERGLGLALVRRLAERQGGSARAGEAADGGAEFSVVLPEALR